MKAINKGKTKIEAGDLLRFTRQYGKSRMFLYKLLGIPFGMEKVNLEAKHND